MPQVESSRSDYTGFMVNRIALATMLLALAAPSWASGEALQDARTMANGGVGAYDGGCTGGSCGARSIVTASDGALKTGGLVTTEDRGPRPAMRAEVPAPGLGEDKEGSKDKPGFFKRLFSGK